MSDRNPPRGLRLGTRDTPWSESRFPVVVGVDGSEGNQSAVQYAVAEAAAIGHPLLLVAVVDEPSYHSANASSYPDADFGWDLLTRLHRDAVETHPGLQVRHAVVFGNTVDCLLRHARRADRLVLGRRGLGTFSRMILGSTSTAAAGRSERPVVIVPTGWDPGLHREQPVVAGVGLDDPDEATLQFAFEEAERRRVALQVVHAIDIEPQLVWDPALGGPTYRHWAADSEACLEDAVEPLQSKFPDVAVTLADLRGNPATALLERSHKAQLLVVGRRHQGPFGFAMGSTARAVLHYADLPVAVVPS